MSVPTQAKIFEAWLREGTRNDVRPIPRKDDIAGIGRAVGYALEMGHG